MSSATFYKWRAKFGGMDASMVARLEEVVKVSRRLELVQKAVQDKAITIAFALFGLSEICFVIKQNSVMKTLPMEQ